MTTGSEISQPIQDALVRKHIPSQLSLKKWLQELAWGSILLCILLMGLSGAVVWRTYVQIGETSRLAMKEVAAKWTLPPGAYLEAGPSSFLYDADKKQLIYRGPLDAQQQLRLRDLLKFNTSAEVQDGSSGPGAASATRLGSKTASANNARLIASQSSAIHTLTATEGQQVTSAYHAAIGQLAYLAHAAQANQVQLLLYLGMLGATLGALLRSFVDFVGHACYKQDLDLKRWWPLYATRPMVGSILGFLLVVLFKAKMLAGVDVPSGDETFWWIGVAALGGFSTLDVTGRLRLAAKALFGSTSESDGKAKTI